MFSQEGLHIVLAQTHTKGLFLPVDRETPFTSPVPGGVGLRVPVATSRLELPPDLL